MSDEFEWPKGEQFEPIEPHKLTPRVLAAWETMAKLGARNIKVGDWNWPVAIRSLLAAIREKESGK